MEEGKEKRMETHFQKELQELKEELLKMAALVEEAISNAIQSLVRRDSGLAKKTFEGEDQINRMEIHIGIIALN
jgi:phosphate transport system protein